jgi:hypothetical protein
MNLKRTAAYTQSLPSWCSFQYDSRFPRSAQDRLWRRITGELANGSFWPRRLGRSPHGLALRDFEITTYEDYRPAITSDFETTRSSLTGRELRHWIESSGTTGGRKLFPLTDAHYGARLKFNRIYAIGLLQRNPNLLVRPSLILSAAERKEVSPAGIPVGYSSDYNARRLRSPSLSAIPAAVYRDTATFLQWAPLYAIAVDLSHIMGMAASRVVRFLEGLPPLLAEYRPYLRGDKPVPDGLPPLKVGADRLAVIERALGSARFLLRDLWPSFRAVTAWKTSTCGLQLPALQPYLSPEDAVLDYPYVASEGVFTVGVGDGPGGPCAIGLTLTEFLDVADEPRGANLRSCWELEQGREYEIFLTSLMGLVRYRMFDRVRCTGYYHGVATIEFVGKTAGQLVLGGGAVVNEVEVTACLTQAMPDFQGRCIIGVRSSGNGLILYHQSDAPDIRERAQALDRALRTRNPTYDWAITVGTLVPMEAMQLPIGHTLWTSQPDHAQAKHRVLTEAQLGDRR